jgi:hypothetical protein
MINGEGNPRPLHIDICVSLKVGGSGIILINEKLLVDALH